MKVRVLAMLAILLLLGADAPKEAERPELNEKVLEFARSKLGKKVGDGECATLAVQALRTAKARGWSMRRENDYVWGKLVRTVTPKKNLAGDVLPGDILQFKDAFLSSKVGRATTEFVYPRHTSIVAAVKDDGKVVEVLHQNVGDSDAADADRRKVQRGTLRFADLKKGTVKIYRPLPSEKEKK
jgi:hypothetical protein